MDVCVLALKGKTEEGTLKYAANVAKGRVGFRASQLSITVTKYLRKTIEKGEGVIWFMVSEVSSHSLLFPMLFLMQESRASWEKAMVEPICVPQGFQEVEREAARSKIHPANGASSS